MIAALAAGACGRFGYDDLPRDEFPSHDEVVARSDCAPLPDPGGPIVDVEPGDSARLAALIGDAEPGTTFRFAAGTYPVIETIAVTANQVALRSASGNPGDVVIDGGDSVTAIEVSASNVAIAELTVAGGSNQSIQIAAGTGAILYRVTVRDPHRVGIDLGVAESAEFADDGVIACSTVELSDAGRTDLTSCGELQGIAGIAVRGWTIRNSTIAGFHCSPASGGFAIHFSGGSRDIVIERNRIDDAWFGMRLGYDPAPGDSSRRYTDDPCPGGYADFIGGVVRNNFLHVTDAVSNADAGIGLWAACQAQVVHNTLLSTRAAPPFSSIEWRYPETRESTVANNLVGYSMLEREGAIVIASGNLQSDQLATLVVDPAAGDLHLSAAAANPAVDTGVPLEVGICDDDADGQPRDLAPDVGADER